MNAPPSRSPSRSPSPRAAWPVLLAAALLVAAVALPRIDASRPAPRYQVSFDVSQSMDVEDVVVDGAPASRLELARRAAAGLLADLPCGSMLGWSAFVGQRVTTLVEPLETCAHYEALLSSLEGVDGRLRWENGSSVGKGLHQSLRAASEIDEGVAVLMFSDGHEAPPLREGATGMPRNPADGVGGTVLGVGGDVPVRVPKSDSEGRRVGWWSDEDVVQLPGAAAATSRESLSRLHGEHLEALAGLAGLGYARLEDPDALWPLLRADADRARVPTDFSWAPALVALAALAWRFAPRRATRAARAARRDGVDGGGEQSSRRAARRWRAGYTGAQTEQEY